MTNATKKNVLFVVDDKKIQKLNFYFARGFQNFVETKWVPLTSLIDLVVNIIIAFP